MRKPNLAEMIVLGFASYMAFTLLFERNWMYDNIKENPDSMYVAYLEFMGTQTNMAILSIVLVVATASILFIDNYLARIAVNIFGLIYFTILAASYVFSYPNIGLGMAIILMFLMVVNINRLIDEQQEARKRKIMYDSYKQEDGDTDENEHESQI